MLTRPQLVNVLLFLEAAPHGTGLQARAWAQTYEAVQLEVEKLAAAEKSTETPAAPAEKRLGLPPVKRPPAEEKK